MGHAPQLDDLAAATLDQISIDWRNGIALVTFLPSPKMHESYVIRAEGVSRVELTRGDAPSRVVKSAASPRAGVMEVALESGEKLHVEARSIVLAGIGG